MYERYCELRNLKNLTDTQVAEYCGFSKSTLSDWKSRKGTPKLDKIQKIAECLGVSIDYLATGKETSDKFSDKNAHLVAKIRNDAELSSALQKYFEFSDVKKKHVIELINLLSE